jgi:hypothetical protein
MDYRTYQCTESGWSSGGEPCTGNHNDGTEHAIVNTTCPDGQLTDATGTCVPMAGVVWTARESNRDWSSVASSADGTKLVATVFGGNIYTSTDSGVTWTPRATQQHWSQVASSADGTRLVATAYGGNIYTSTDSGEAWTPRATSQAWSSVASSADGSNLVATVYDGHIYTSADAGMTWSQRGRWDYWLYVASSAYGIKLVAAAYVGIYTSADAGVTWTLRIPIKQFWALASSADGTKLVAAGGDGDGDNIYTSTDSGETWIPRFTVELRVSSVASSADGTKLIAATFGGYLYTSTDSGMTWTPHASQEYWNSAVSSSADGTKLVAVFGEDDSIYTSSGPASCGDQACSGNPGTACQCAGDQGPSGAPSTAACGQTFCGMDNQTYACNESGWSHGGQPCTGNTDGGAVCQCEGQGPGGAPLIAACGQAICGMDLHTQQCNASGWSTIGQPCTNNTDGGPVCRCEGQGPGGALLTAACGQTVCGMDFQTHQCKPSGWSTIGQPCTSNDDGGIPHCQCEGQGAGGVALTTGCGETVCGMDYRTYQCNGVGWSYGGEPCTGNHNDGTGHAIVSTTCPAGQLTDWTGTCVPMAGVVWTEREDNSWSSVASSTDGTKLVATTYGGNIYTSTDSGVTWTPRATQQDWGQVASSADGTKLIAVVPYGYIYTSIDSGETWTPRATPQRWTWVASSADGTKLVATVYGGYIYTSADAGVTWTQRGASEGSVASSADGNKLVICGLHGIFTSADAGVTWTQRTTSECKALASSADGTKLVAAMYDYLDSVYTSTDSGETWIPQFNVEGGRWLSAAASSADGTTLIVAAIGNYLYGGYFYTSTDSGATWTPRATEEFWYGVVVASSADGTKLIAAGQKANLYTSSGPVP